MFFLLNLVTGKQIFEKMVSGMYMGEVVRQVVVDLQHNGLIFQVELVIRVYKYMGEVVR